VSMQLGASPRLELAFGTASECTTGEPRQHMSGGSYDKRCVVGGSNDHVRDCASAKLSSGGGATEVQQCQGLQPRLDLTSSSCSAPPSDRDMIEALRRPVARECTHGYTTHMNDVCASCSSHVYLLHMNDV